MVDEIDARGLIGRVAERGPALREELEAALAGNEIVREVRGRGFLLGIDLVDPGDGESILPDELRAHEIVDDAALRHGVMVTSTHSNRDGYAGDQTTIAPAYVAGEEELVGAGRAGCGGAQRRRAGDQASAGGSDADPTRMSPPRPKANTFCSAFRT